MLDCKIGFYDYINYYDNVYGNGNNMNIGNAVKDAMERNDHHSVRNDGEVIELPDSNECNDNSTPSTNSRNSVIVEEYMTCTTIKIYPNGQKYVTSKSWFKGVKQDNKPRKKGKKKEMAQTQLQEVEEY